MWPLICNGNHCNESSTQSATKLYFNRFGTWHRYSLQRAINQLYIHRLCECVFSIFFIIFHCHDPILHTPCAFALKSNGERALYAMNSIVNLLNFLVVLVFQIGIVSDLCTQFDVASFITIDSQSFQQMTCCCMCISIIILIYEISLSQYRCCTIPYGTWKGDITYPNFMQVA